MTKVSIVGLDCCNTHCALLTVDKTGVYSAYILDNNLTVLNGTQVETAEGSRGYKEIRVLRTNDPNNLAAVLIQDTSRYVTDSQITSVVATRDGEEWLLSGNDYSLYYQL